MSRKVRRVPVRLDTGGIKRLPDDEIKVILRAADELIMQGGRNLLAKILKGSREAKVLELGLTKCPVYGFFKDLPTAEVMAKIDWLIVNDYLKIEYDYRMPLLVYTDKGWEIERETFAQELFEDLGKVADGEIGFDTVDGLKDRNRGMILLLLEKIKASGDRRYLPVLEYWETIDCKKVRQVIRDVMGEFIEKDTKQT
jgi:hypothetical protein